MVAAISKKTWLGVAKESTPGTAIVTPTLYVPTKSTLKQMVKREYLDEERGDRNADYDGITTTRWTDWDMKGPFYPDSMVYFLMAALGGDTVTQPNAAAAPTVYKHTIGLADIPPALTLHKSYASQFYYAPYSCVEKFSFKIGGPEKLMEFDASGKAIWATINGSPPTPSFTQVQPFSGYAPTLKLFNAQTSDISEITINFEQKVTLWFPLNGVQDWITAYYGERKVHLDFTARFDNDTLYQRFRTGNGYDMFSLDIQGQNLANLWVVTLGAPSAGNFTLTYGGQTTANIAYNAVASAVQSSLQALSSVGTGNATVTGSAGGPYTINFSPTLATSNVLTGSGAGLTGGTFSIGAQSLLNRELNIVIPVIGYDSMEHDAGKDNVLIKAKATALATQQTINGQAQDGTGNNLIQLFVQNSVASYSV